MTRILKLLATFTVTAMLPIRRFLTLCAIASLTACSALPDNQEKPQSFAFDNTQHTLLAQALSHHHSLNNNHSRAVLLHEGTDAFVMRLALIEAAEKSLDLQYYIWHDDLVGQLMLQGLLKAADRGVRVRLLLDDISINKKLQSMLYVADQHKNINVFLFNPFAARNFHLEDFIFDGARMNRRMHNKALIADNQLTVVGGRNIGNEYFQADQQANFHDVDVLAGGKVVNLVSQAFDLYWNSQVAYPINAFSQNKAKPEQLTQLKNELAQYIAQYKDSAYSIDLHQSQIYQRLTNETLRKEQPLTYFVGPTDVLYDDPRKALGKSSKEVVYLKDLSKPHWDSATKSIEIISPYFVPGKSGVKQLAELVNKGIDVRVVTNSLSSTDGVLAQSGYARHRKKLLQAGVKLYEIRTDIKSEASKSLKHSEKAKSGLHSKVYILDRKKVFIGSFNFDQRSANINTEVGISYDIPEMAQFIGEHIFDKGIEQKSYRLTLDKNGDVIWQESNGAQQIIYTTDPKTSLWRRFVENVYSVLPIESQL